MSSSTQQVLLKISDGLGISREKHDGSSWPSYRNSGCALFCCNTRFTKGHKPSNHICARIKSHVYTIEWTVYHSTYHVKRYNKASTNVIYYINDKMSNTNMRKRRTSTKLWSWAPQGHRLGDDRLEVLILLVAPGELLRIAENWAAVGCPQREQEEKSRVGKSEYTTCTQQV
jgi:hypothetical protein